jgi:C_GCAxxG_C_C family probable redox protein
MISKGELSFNCCESVLIRVDKPHPLPGFSRHVLRIASNFGGGVGGWGSICGAVSGANMALGLLYGTDGTESFDEFMEKRDKQKSLAKEFMRSFEDKFGSVNCLKLLGVDFRTEEGNKIYEEMKARGETHCGEYVEWAAKKTLDIIS